MGETRVTIHEYRIGTHQLDDAADSATLIGRLEAGQLYAVAFGGQGVPWLAPLAELVVDADLDHELRALVTAAEQLLEPIADRLAPARPAGFTPLDWARAQAAADAAEDLDDAAAGDSAVPSHALLTSAAVSVPGIVLTQLAAIRALRKQGVDFAATPPARIVGHSQGVLAVAALSDGSEGAGEGAILAFAQLIGAAGAIVAGRTGLVAGADGSPMLSVSNIEPQRMADILDEYRETLAAEERPFAPVISIVNGRRSVVLSGRPHQLRAVQQLCEQIAEAEADERTRKVTGGAPLNPTFDDLDVAIGFHHPALAPAVDLAVEWAGPLGPDAARAREAAEAVLVDPVDWPAAIESVVESGAAWVLDLGPGDVATRLSTPLLRGRGVGYVAASTRGGQRNLFSPGGIPEVPASWSSHRPQLIELPDGRRVVDTAFTRLTGRSPILLAGMTPTTVDPAIVAAAANGGHWAELAGGGQVTEAIFAENLAKLNELLEPGRQVQFNSLFLDPYLWKLQLGGTRLVQKARAAGAPLDGVIVTAGIPELEDAVELIGELADAGFPYIAFKPGTVEQIRAVIRIAAEVPHFPVIVHVEGGRAGGHHSWEDLDDLLLSTYAELRARENAIVCVGGGIGTPERASAYLTGAWSTEHGYPAMPLDGILVGTAAMATLEATTAPAVKQLLVDTPGHPEWIGAGHASGGMASGRSQLGADIHEIDNAASTAGRLLDEVAGDADAVAARRDEVIAAIAGTAKPYYGDVATMTYRQWLQRYLELSADFRGAEVNWTDVTWEDRFVEMIERAQARLHPVDRGPIEALVTREQILADPQAAIETIAAAYPEIDSDILHPADVAFFLELCRTPGKPVNFVPVIDKDVRRWWRSDSLWQAHDDRYSADAVCIIPGPVAVAGITKVDEPVADLLDRFEARVVADLTAAGVPAPAAGARRLAGTADGGVLRLATLADHVQWSGRMVPNPIVLLGDRDKWQFFGEDRATHEPTGAELERDGDTVVLRAPVGRSELTLTLEIDESAIDGGAPRVSAEAAADAMRTLLTIAGGGDLPSAQNGVATLTTELTPEIVADHAAVTTFSFPQRLTASVPRTGAGFINPDAVLGLAWPAIFAVIGSAAAADGTPLLEGLLDLVHLDHAARTVNTIPVIGAAVAIAAEVQSVVDADLGRVITVEVTVSEAAASDGAEPKDLLVFTERFAVLGRGGGDALADPVRAGGALSDSATDTQRRKLRVASITAPDYMGGFAAVSGDHNPIHTDAVAAKMAGLGDPIAHGMWLSAAAQHVATSVDSVDPIPVPRALTGWTARFTGMVRLGDQIDLRVDRVGRDNGGDIIEVTAKVGDNLVMAATGRLAAPKTVYAFPGQGIQSKGMGLDARASSAAARDVWDRADAHTREALGFSILAVVRDNPTTLTIGDTVYHHPDGVLFLTQFTQVAMATLGVAQIAELKESGAFVEGAITCGHSVGEYNALAACAGVLPLNAVLEVVFQRGEAMHHLVPRDSKGRSNYRLAAIRPSQFGMSDDEVVEFVAELGRSEGEFLEVVNLNLLGSQYAIAGTVAGLERLEAEIDRRRAEFGGKRAFILIPGIDVPFHSTVLRDGVPEFRHRLEELLPETIDPEILVGRYIPNLVPRLFNLSRDYVQEVADLVPSQPLDEVLADWDRWAARPSELTRVLLIELLAWQFASPVRWIETQDLLFTPVERGGLGIERIVEVGVQSAPTLAGLATNTLKLPGYSDARVQVLNLQRDSAVVLSDDAGPDIDDELEETVEAPAAPAPAAAPVAAAPAAPVADPAAPRPADIPFGPADAVKTVIAQWTKIRLDQIGPADTIEALCDGVSSRRNQLLLDVGTELGLGAIDGAAEADMGALSTTVNALARGYKPFGAVLTDAIGDQLRKVFGPKGKRPGYVAERVTSVWQLDAGWAQHASAVIALETRDGASVRGGDLSSLGVDFGDIDGLIDAAVAKVGADRGIAVSKPAAAGNGGGTVDAAALGELTEQITGRDGALAAAAHAILAKLGLDEAPADITDVDEADSAAIELVSNELGTDWLRAVAPAFDARRAVLLDDRWASQREDLARLWLTDEHDIDRDHEDITARFAGAGDVVAEHATWWQGKALAVGDSVRARVYAHIAHAAEDPAPGQWSDEVAVITGASDGSIAAAIAAGLLRGGATVVATTSRLNDERLAFFKQLYRDNARHGAALWVLPANMASYADVDALIEWIGNEQTENQGGANVVVKDELKPTLLFPFAAPRVMGTLAEAGPRAELEMKILLWSVERMIGGLSKIHADHNISAKLHVVLPGSPNRGMFGGDGAYGEAKAALDALVTRWSAESAWNSSVTLAHALIGWVRGTGLMGQNDPMVEAVEAEGVRTWSTDEMAAELLAICSPQSRTEAADKPLVVDLTAGLSTANLDLPALMEQATKDADEKVAEESGAATGSAVDTIDALPAPARPDSVLSHNWSQIDAAPEDLVVIVGAGEVGPYGSSRTRFEMEVSEELSAAGVVELAWNTGLIVWEETPKPGWYDGETGEPVAEAEIAERYHDAVVERCGIRRYGDDGAMVDNSAPLLESVFLEEDVTFSVGSEAAARAFLSAEPGDTRIFTDPETGDWKVTRKAGTQIRVPRRFEMSRTVGGQIPTGFDPTRWGVSADMAESIDRVALWNLVATVDAFLSSGFEPAELMRWVHPGLVANTQGTGMGGMTSMRSLYIDTLLGESKANDILQEALPNVVAAHVVQSYIGSYGAMIHPVAACATAAVSVEEGVDKIKLGKALFAVAGGFDDLGIEGIVGFGDMSATADSAAMADKGIDPRRFSRANDRRRGGFVESQGGGTVLLARGDVAAEMGLPVLGVVAWAQSFGDGVHTSIPAPGIGALGVARGQENSPMARALRTLGVSPDDVAVVSKHDTSTKANDPNEAELHERLADALGRSSGAPLFVVSQKSLTGHAKGGAAAFQLIGLCQMLAAGVIPPNRSLDCVDEEMAEHQRLVWPREALHFGERFPLKAGLLTSLGFGHVSGLIAVVHPEAFVASLDSEQRDQYRARAAERSRLGRQRLLQSMHGGDAAYSKPASGRRLPDADAHEAEAQMLLDPQARLNGTGAYPSVTGNTAQ
jgi:fatty acid synthase